MASSGICLGRGCFACRCSIYSGRTGWPGIGMLWRYLIGKACAGLGLKGRWGREKSRTRRYEGCDLFRFQRLRRSRTSYGKQKWHFDAALTGSDRGCYYYQEIRSASYWAWNCYDLGSSHATS